MIFDVTETYMNSSDPIRAKPSHGKKKVWEVVSANIAISDRLSEYHHNHQNLGEDKPSASQEMISPG